MKVMNNGMREEQQSIEKDGEGKEEGMDGERGEVKWNGRG